MSKESNAICPRCGLHPRKTIVWIDADDKQQTRLAKWCEECLGTP